MPSVKSGRKMAETIKSALFVDHDSIYRSLRTANAQAADRLAQRAGAWVAAIESGRLVSPKKAEGAPRRRVAVKRCYADLRELGKSRNAFVASGFEIIDCPRAAERSKNAADVQVAIDAMDALSRPDAFDEFVLLSADADWTPVLRRLGANNKTRIVYANGATAVSYKSLAEAVVDEVPLALLLSADEVAVSSAAETASTARGRRGDGKGADRADIEALARKIHAATNVPLFSPRAFAELFRALTEEIAASGYHFQTTAENVAAKLTASGRSITRRQVVFVVKGLALKGHVFSTTDTPERLAEVFREQVLYLVGNAGLELSEQERATLPAWIVGATAAQIVEAEPQAETVRPDPTRSKAEPAKPTPVAAAAEVETTEAASRPATEDAPAKGTRRRAAKSAKDEVAEPPKPAPTVARTPEPVEKAATPPIRAAEPAEKRALAAAQPVEPVEKPVPTPLRPSEAIKLAASRIAAARPATAAKPPVAAPKAETPAAKVPAPAKPASPAQRPAAAPAKPPAAADKSKEALESSILAAIAQAVDVLVEDSEGPPAEEPEAAPPVAEERPDPTPSDGGDSDDIGDEIQRIIASYSRARRGETG